MIRPSPIDTSLANALPMFVRAALLVMKMKSMMDGSDCTVQCFILTSIPM